jgi:hypothetical protein
LKNGAVEFVSSRTSIGGYEDIFTGICCAPESIIGSDDVFVAQYTVSISNNGIHFGNEESVYVFDSVCQSISTSESGSKSFSLKVLTVVFLFARMLRSKCYYSLLVDNIRHVF